MAANRLIFMNAERARDAITVSQKREIESLYKEWAKEVGKKADKFKRSPTSSSVLAEQQMRELQSTMETMGKQVANEVYSKIKRNMYIIADEVVSSNAKWAESLGLGGKGLSAAFSHIPDQVVRNLITGQVYDSGWSLSSAIWSSNEDIMRQAYQIVAGGLAQNQSIYDIARNLEQYVSPGAKRPWNLRAPDGKLIYPRRVDYSAQRLARTLAQHSYQQGFIASTIHNPFITDYIWDANGSRVCKLCMSRDGEHYAKNELPLDHPNGMCTMVPNVVDDLSDRLADWHNKPHGTYPDIDRYAASLRR